LAKAAVRLLNTPVTSAMLADASAALANELDPNEDQQASAAMRLHLAKVLMVRCAGALLGRDDLGSGSPA
jgi:carbon-monoxide dehydrogenase medium subunit